MNKAKYDEITVRLLGTQAPNAKPISTVQVRRIRQRAKLSQAEFARYLNRSVGYISQLERDAKQPKGPALALLNVIRRKGLEVIM
jgi:putative transcriptional regulator